MATIPFKGESIDTVTGLSGALAAKANVAHAHAYTDIVGLGSMAVATAADYLAKADNLSGIADAAAARTNLSAAAATHVHSTADITSGELATARGGRGRGNFGAAGRISFAASTTAETDASGFHYGVVGSGLAVGANTDASYTGGTYIAAGLVHGKLANSNNDSWRLDRGVGVRLGSDCGVFFAQSASANSTLDTGLVKHTAGVIRISNGSTDTGNLLIGPSSATKRANVALQITSTTQGFCGPRMTAAQRDAISVSAIDYGLLIFNTDTERYEVYTSSGWGTVMLLF